MTVAAPAFDLAGLAAAVARADSAALLVPPRILRRVIKQDRGLTGLGFRVPHYKTYVIGRDALLQIADRAELGLPPDRELPETVILLQQPHASALRDKAEPEVLLVLWRLLFHARVHIAIAARGLDKPAVAERVRRLGTAVFNEVRSVVRQEHFLLPPGDGKTVYEEFAALYLELRYFAPCLLPRYFPAVVDPDAVDELLAQDVGSDSLFDRTRPARAPLPEAPTEHLEAASETSGRPVPMPENDATVITPRADRAARRGNDVRAARLYVRAGRRDAALEALQRLTTRLQRALQLPAAEEEQWRSALEPLLRPAARGWWPVEARLLYDLQSVCVNQEKELYAVDLVEWAVTWGQRPIKRLLPHQPYVFTVKYLRRALRRLDVAEMPDEARHRLHRLLEDALHHAEIRLRQRFRPLIVGALDSAGLTPPTYAERLARDQIVEELLDRVVARGFFTMSDVRDTLARNRLKLPDVPSPVRILTGDRLIQANRRLAVALDGVYRRGEIYLRWLQRLSSVFFGTAIGRFLVLYLILPLGGACVAVKGPQLVGDEVSHLSRRVVRLFGGEPAEPGGPSHHGGLQFQESDIVPILLADLFFLGLLHSAQFRRVIGAGLHFVYRCLRRLLYDFPTAVSRWPPLRRLLQSRGYLLLYQFVVKPALWAVPLPLVLWLFGVQPAVLAVTAGAVFVVAQVLLNSRAGMVAEEALGDAVERGWLLFSNDILPGLFRQVMGFFKWVLEAVDSCIYTVDEWLRFRTGDSRLSLIVKPVLGLIWFAVTYVFRLVITLFIEPTLNPIKHFPVVTVAAKLLLPLIPVLNASLLAMLEPVVGRALGHVLALTAIMMLPGVAGFLVWELKENWKLYRANQPEELEPVVIGSHGETMLRLMRPGIHSGTLPKLYARLRRYERRGQEGRARKRLEDLHHVEEAVRHFAERDLVAVLDGSHGWNRRLFVGVVHAATDEIRVELGGAPLDVSRTSLAPENMEIAFEEQSGQLVAGVLQPGWLAHLGRDERLVLADALAGFYKLAGVALVREQVAAVLEPDATWSIRDERLVVWQDGRVQTYDLDDKSALPWDRLRFDRSPVRWSDWVAAWERDQDGKSHEPPLLPGLRLLPEGPVAAVVPQTPV